MLYYRVKTQYDQYPLYKRTAKGYKTDRTLIAKELYTQSEINNFRKNYINCNSDLFDLITINKNDTYWSFGARFN